MTAEPAVGPFYGLRSFLVSSNGMLCSPVTKTEFPPGVNEAECHPDMVRSAAPHTVGARDCTCGYWSYVDERYNNYYDSTRSVMAVTANAGTVTCASRGMRASQSQVVALIEPRQSDDWRGRVITGLSAIGAISVLWVGISFAVMMAVAAYNMFVYLTGWDISYTNPFIGLGSIVLLATGVAVVAASIKVTDYLQDHGWPGMLQWRKFADTGQIAALRSNYPDVVWFDSVEDARDMFTLGGPRRTIET